MQAVYYRDPDGREPVNDFVDSLPPERQEEVDLHALEKRTGALPQADIDIAKKRFEDFRERMEQRPRRPPRPAGHDAP